MPFATIRKSASLIRQALSRLSLRFRLTFIYVLIFGVTTMAFSVATFTSTLQTLQKDFDDGLHNYAIDVTDSIRITPRGQPLVDEFAIDTEKIFPFPLGTSLILVRRQNGDVLLRRGDLEDFGEFVPPYRRDFAEAARTLDSVFRTIDAGGTIPRPEAEQYRVISVPLEGLKTKDLYLQIAAPMILLETQISRRLFVLQFGFPIVLLIAILGGLFVSSRALKPIDSMIRGAREIGARDLTSRIPVPLARDEIRSLAETLNEMLGRIERAFQSQERFIADASHQLMTPLSILRGEIEVFAQSPRSPEETQHLFRSLIQEIDGMSRLVQDMLLLARVDAGLDALNFESLDADELLFESLARLEKAAQQRGQALHVELLGDESLRANVHGDRDLLAQLLGNLIENAVKYSPRGETLRLEREWFQDAIEYRILDRGPGLQGTEIESLFERFRRAQGADQQAPGVGLGLAIAHQIARLHEASLSAENRAGGGAIFRLRLKKV